MEAKKFISYTRVSTTKQDAGLAAQTAIIAAYVKNNGGVIIATFSEKESGKETLNRHQLQAAITLAHSTGATLIASKLDRLSRDVADIFTLKKDTRLHFELCDMDASDTLMMSVIGGLAQKERELISQRTREALAVKKAQGVKLGSPKARETMLAINHMGVEARKRIARENECSKKAWFAIRFMPGTLREKAEYLNANGFRTRNGKPFAAMSVKRLQAMYL